MHHFRVVVGCVVYHKTEDYGPGTVAEIVRSGRTMRVRVTWAKKAPEDLIDPKALRLSPPDTKNHRKTIIFCNQRNPRAGGGSVVT